MVVIFVSCREEDPLPAAPAVNTANTYVNDWIYENMAHWYLWNTTLPASPDKNLDPESFFTSLKYSGDRFSWIQPNYKDLLNSLQGITREAGYEFVLYRDKENSDNVILQILYTKPGSPASDAGLKRGDVITHINEKRLTVQNYQSLLKDIRQPHDVRYKPLIVGEDRFGAEQKVSLSAIEYAENPNYLHQVIEVGGRKAGYFVYNFFASGTDAMPRQYDDEMDAIFGTFKAAGITDLIIDLRFNSGGSEVSAKNLASYIGRGLDENKVFARREYNKQVEEAILKDKNLGPGFLISKFQTKANNIGNQLSNGRVYVLTSSRTASASELIINALKPFMDVFLIGDITYGKNVGSVSLYEEKDAKNPWGMQPIVVKVYNSLDQSDYGTGFTPDVLHKDNGLYIYPLGDSREALLSQALARITGTGTLGRVDARGPRTPVAHSLDFKQRGFELVIDDALPAARRGQ